MTLRELKKKRQYIEPGGRTTPKSNEPVENKRYSRQEESTREKQRPPIYNPEDYAYWIKKWGKKSGHGIISLYSTSSMSDLESNYSQSHSYRDYRNPMLSSSGMEMTLRQFGTVSELLAKLKCDLRLAYPSFVQEFVADPLDGVTVLLDLLRAIQLSQSNAGQVQNCSPGGTTPKLSPALQRRTLLDELACLQCLYNCCVRYSESVRKLTASSAGLFTLAICIMSNVNKSRILALQLLSKACEPPSSCHSAVSEAMSTLRLRFGEPVRFRFLVGMLSSAGSHIELLTSGLKFINSFLNTAESVQKRVYLQAELEQAGFDLAMIKKNIGVNVNACETLFDEMDVFEKHFVDIENLTIRTESAEKENDNLRDRLADLEQKIQVLQEEKGILISMDQCLRDKCSELREEVQSLKSAQSVDASSRLSKNPESTPEDEGISSSERTPSPEAEIQPTSTVYEIYTAPEEPLGNESEEETTIEDVIQELQDIISNEETQDYNRENLKLNNERRRVEESQIAGKFKIHLDIDDYALQSDYEIIPSNLQPEPPRKSRSLIHLFMPTADYDYHSKELFFETESLTTDSSFSLVDVSKYCPPLFENKTESKPIEPTSIKNVSHNKNSKVTVKRSESFRQLPKTTPNVEQNIYSERYQFNIPPEVSTFKRNLQKNKKHNLSNKCMSLDRVDNSIDVSNGVVLNKVKTIASRSKSDSENILTTTNKSITNVYINQDKDIKYKLGSYSEEKHRMFLPSYSEENEVLYYFPRIQERKPSNSSSFLLNRGFSNAGLYSGQTFETHHYFNRSREVIGSDCRSSGKLTDFPSGLY
ncbi:uncharacterized protein LOC126888883 [Diabrotica virgifera virgifera]|uniref:GBD/FH3 domain-containing protein n=1 Tax=Diabrotica virgifera virgifera TaxID=50390 RepID=A0ABM5KSW0_DIAVI|nr:uncharacterized protein LOC126888883 [Diabrotica virgifera virgifera]